MPDEYITRTEHDEFARRIDDRNERQDARLKTLESDVKAISELNTSIEKLALNMENMCKEQKRQGERLDTLESRDGENWRKAVGYVLAGVIGAVVGFALKQIGIF